MALDPFNPRSLHEVAIKHGLEPPLEGDVISTYLLKCLGAMMAEIEARLPKETADSIAENERDFRVAVATIDALDKAGKLD
jgi:hypothetical protein